MMTVYNGSFINDQTAMEVVEPIEVKLNNLHLSKATLQEEILLSTDQQRTLDLQRHLDSIEKQIQQAGENFDTTINLKDIKTSNIIQKQIPTNKLGITQARRNNDEQTDDKNAWARHPTFFAANMARLTKHDSQ